MKTYYNAALRPENNVLPACMIGLIGSSRKRPNYRGTTDFEQITCERCLRKLGKKG